MGYDMTADPATEMLTLQQGEHEFLAVEEALGLPAKFIENLITEDDWSLVIKVHSLLESACSDMLSLFFGKPELVDIFSQMEMSNKKTGKLAFISNLNLLSKKERRFISQLSELRNQLVHNAKNVTFSLQKHFENLSTEQRKKAFEGLNIRLSSITRNGIESKGHDLLTSSPKTVICCSLNECLFSIYQQNIISIKRNSLIKESIEKLKENGPIYLSEKDIPKTTDPKKVL